MMGRRPQGASELRYRARRQPADACRSSAAQHQALGHPAQGAEVVAAVRGGLLSLDEACKRYTLTVEEFLAWQRAIDRFGLAGLRATRVQQYRN